MYKTSQQKYKTSRLQLSSLRRKSATMFLWENCQRQSCKAFIGLTIRTKIGGGRPVYAKIWWMMTYPFAMRRFSIYFCS